MFVCVYVLHCTQRTYNRNVLETGSILLIHLATVEYGTNYTGSKNTIQIKKNKIATNNRSRRPIFSKMRSKIRRKTTVGRPKTPIYQKSTEIDRIRRPFGAPTLQVTVKFEMDT